MKRTSIESMRTALRKYVRSSVLDHSIEIMQKLGRAEDGLTHREVAELVYLSCGVGDDVRARTAVEMERDNTTAGRAVLEIMRLLLEPDGSNESGIPTSVLRDLSRSFHGRTAPGYFNGKQIQVRGGGGRNWTPHAASYVLE